MRLESLAIAFPFVWVAAWILGSALYRRRFGKPIFPRVPDSATFSEAWTSGRSLKNVLTRIGGAKNCLLVYVADGKLAIVPVFPFTLLFVPEVCDLEISVPISKIGITSIDGLLGKRLRLSFEPFGVHKFELSLRNPQGFQEAIGGKQVSVARSPGITPPRFERATWRMIFARLFAIIWGVGAMAAGLTSLQEDIRFRTDGIITKGQIVGHTGKTGTKNDSGIVQYVAQGQSYRITSIRGSGIYRIGDFVQVRYMPNDPASGREDGNLIFSLLFTALGFCVLALGVGLGRIARTFRRRMNA